MKDHTQLQLSSNRLFDKDWCALKGRVLPRERPLAVRISSVKVIQLVANTARD